MLFSEPKIPQLSVRMTGVNLNVSFQCSSASRKFLNAGGAPDLHEAQERFSALQRAENSSTRSPRCAAAGCRVFQCSSASRKFLNVICCRGAFARRHVSVLFSEPKIPQPRQTAASSSSSRVSVLFSEPKIPQRDVFGNSAFFDETFQCSSASRKFLNSLSHLSAFTKSSVSVLFSEPKIPQPRDKLPELVARLGFQCSSASRKFLNRISAG